MYKKIIFISLVIVLIFLGIVAYNQSSSLKAQGDQLLKNNKPKEALIFYKEANNIFPFRKDITESVSGTQLIINSELEYNEIVDLDYAEVQKLPDLNSLFHQNTKPGELVVPILMYHHIRINPKPNDPLWASLNVSPELLDSELNYLSTHNYNTITLDDLNESLTKGTSLPSNPIILTFDDGYSDFYDNAFPLLKKYNMKAIEFVITNVETAPAYLSWGQILDIDKSGFVQFGAHTQNHPDLRYLSPALINKEIEGSKSELENHLGKETKWFAYPYGSYNDYIVNEVVKAGFVGAVSTNYSSIQSKQKLYLLPRIMADGRFGIDEFAKRLQNE